jgi:hypothetical protein
MMPTIRVDDEVFEALQKQAQAFVDTPNTVLRRLCNLDEHDAKPNKARRARSSELLTGTAYREPVLRSLARHGGTASPGEVVEDVGKELHDQLKPMDFEPLDSGMIRWENRVRWQRKHLKDEGLIDPSTPDVVWTLSEAGWKAARSLET